MTALPATERPLAVDPVRPSRNTGSPILWIAIGLVALFGSLLIFRSANSDSRLAANPDIVWINQLKASVLSNTEATTLARNGRGPQVLEATGLGTSTQISGDVHHLVSYRTPAADDPEVTESCFGVADLSLVYSSVCIPGTFDEPQVLVTGNSGPMKLHEAALFNTPANSRVWEVETTTGYVISSRVEDGVGFVQWDPQYGGVRHVRVGDQTARMLWVTTFNAAG